MKNLKKKLSLQNPKAKQPEKDLKVKPQPQIPERIHTEINSNFAQKSSSDWKREREFLFSKIKTLEKEVTSLKTKNQELQIQLTLTQTSIESKQSFATTTNENLKIPKKRRIDHKRIYSEMFTSYRKKKFKQNSEDSRSGIGVLKQQLVNQKPKSFGEGTKGIIGNKILSNIIKEFRIDLQEQKKLEKNNCGENSNKTGLLLNNNTINNNQNNKIKKGNNNKFIKNLTTKINNYPIKKGKNNNNLPKKKLNRIQITDNNEDNTYNNINKKKIFCETVNNTENISLVDDIDNKTCSQTKNDLSNDLNGEYYGFYDYSKKVNINNIYNNEINIENLNIDNDNDDFTEKINESSSGQTHLTGETILKKPNDFNSNINTSKSNKSNSLSKSNSTMNNQNANQINDIKDLKSLNIPFIFLSIVVLKDIIEEYLNE